MSEEQDCIDKENERLFGDEQSAARKKYKGMDDDEIIASGEGLESSKRVPKWFFAIIIVVVLIAFGLTLPFWGDRADAPRDWLNWGQLAALAYMLVFGGFVYVMTTMYEGNDDDEYYEDDHDNQDKHDTK